jgi:hypothetical protein
MKPRLVYLVWVCALSLAAGGRAWGQTRSITGQDVSVGYQGLPSRSPANSETGLKVSDGVLMHVGVGAEAGYDSNVFYQQTGALASPLLRVVPFVELNTAARGGAVPSGLFFDLSGSLTYREYLSSDPQIRAQRAFMPSLGATLDFGSDQALSLLVGESFARTEDPPYQAFGTPYVRDNNTAFGQVNWAPGGGRLVAALRYTNLIDYFETNNLLGSSAITHDLMLDVSWKWLPKTAVYVNVRQGYISYFQDGRATSFPLRAIAGMRGLLTPKLTLNIGAGYANGFYSDVNGATGPVGIRGALNVLAEVTYRPTIETIAVLGYRHDFQNAILSDFYYVDAVYLNISQAIAGRVGLGLSARYESRSFNNFLGASGAPVPGATGRHDNYVQAGVNLDYHIQNWSYAGISYSLMKNDSDFVPPPSTGSTVIGAPIYTKQLVFARFGVTY